MIGKVTECVQHKVEYRPCVLYSIYTVYTVHLCTALFCLFITEYIYISGLLSGRQWRTSHDGT